MEQNRRVRVAVDERLAIDGDDVNKVFRSLLGHPAREADKQVVETMGGTVGVLADYLWDHWLGEPSHPTRKEVRSKVVQVLTNAAKQ